MFGIIGRRDVARLLSKRPYGVTAEVAVTLQAQSLILALVATELIVVYRVVMVTHPGLININPEFGWPVLKVVRIENECYEVESEPVTEKSLGAQSGDHVAAFLKLLVCVMSLVQGGGNVAGVIDGVGILIVHGIVGGGQGCLFRQVGYPNILLDSKAKDPSLVACVISYAHLSIFCIYVVFADFRPIDQGRRLDYKSSSGLVTPPPGLLITCV